MKVKMGSGAGLKIGKVKQGDVFRFIGDRTDIAYMMGNSELYICLSTGMVYPSNSCRYEEKVVLYPDASVDLGV